MSHAEYTWSSFHQYIIVNQILYHIIFNQIGPMEEHKIEATPCHCIACRTYLYSPYFTPGVRGEANSGWSQAINDSAESLAKYLTDLFAISNIYF